MNNESKALNITINFTLVCLCAVSYALITILFVSPETFRLDTLIFADSSAIKPTTAVTLLAALLTASTSAYLTRCAEHSLWRKLSLPETEGHISARESHRLAQWSVSPLGRLSYIFSGDGWLLKFSGLFLTGTAIVGPVLVAGISQRASTYTSATNVAPSRSAFSGYLDQANILYNGGQFQDVPMVVAALAQMSNLSAPASSICQDANCRVSARVASVRADCKPKEVENTWGFGSTVPPLASQEFCSDIDSNLCGTLVRSDPTTFANFSTALPPGCQNLGNQNECNGHWCTLFGVWSKSGMRTTTRSPVFQVECDITYGNVTITQKGGNTPVLDRSTFVKSTYELQTYQTGAWRRIYYEAGEGGAPYTFSGARAATGASTLYERYVGWMLLGDDAGDDAETVARRIEANFDMAALMAFARIPASSPLTVTTSYEGRQMWVYSSIYLLILLLPLLATLTGVWGRWKVCDNGLFVGYNPVEIASRSSMMRVFHHEKF